MANLNAKDMKSIAARRLRKTGSNPRQLVLIHTGLVVVLNLVVSWLNLFLNEQIGTTGGLSGLGMRSILQTAQTLLSYFATFFTPFWSAGFLHAMIHIARGEEAGTGDLFDGFRRFGRIMSHTLWMILIMSTACIAMMYVVCNLFVLTPFAEEFLSLMEPLLKNPEMFMADGTLNLELLPLDALFPTMIPLFIMYAAAVIPWCLFLSYVFRMSLFLLVEGIDRGAFGSFFVSAKLMKGHKWQMLKLDLSFWWFYALEALLMVVMYLDFILPMLGVALPINPTIAFFVPISLYGVLELALHWWKKAEIDVTYATAYETIYRQFVPYDASSESN
jgi:uncharacterized membrane protein